MKNFVVVSVLSLALGMGAVACSNPCDKLAKAVCSELKGSDPKLCDTYKAKAKSMRDTKEGKDKCTAGMRNVKQVVAGLRMTEKMKAMFKNLGKSIGNKLKGALKGATDNKPAPTPAPAPAPTK